MSVSFTYKQVDPNNGTYWGSGSELKAVMVAAFGSFPSVLTENDLHTLRVISACGFTDVDNLIDALDKYGKVQIFENY